MMLTVAAMMMKMIMTMRAIMMMMTPMTFDKVLPSRPEDTVPCQQPQLSAPFAPKTKMDDLVRMITEGVKKNLGKSGQADRLGGGSPPSSLTASICESFGPFFSFIKWQNNPKHDNLSRIF